MNRLLPLFVLIGCHLIAGDDAIVDRCTVACAQYAICMENRANGKSDVKECMKPSPACACELLPQHQQAVDICATMCTQHRACMERQTGKADPRRCFAPMPSCKCFSTLPEKVVDICETMCTEYKTCMERQTGKADPRRCFAPMPSCKCFSALPEKVVDICETMCTEYRTCMERQTGKADPRRCFAPMPSCKCFSTSPEIQPAPCVSCGEGRLQLPDDSIIHRCEVGCERFFKCREDKSQGPCVKPADCTCVKPDSPAEKMVVLPMLPDICRPCFDYWFCRQSLMFFPAKSCVRPKECTCKMHKCFTMGLCKEDMPEELEIKEEHPDQPLMNFCNVLCSSFEKCLSSNNPQLSCVRPPGCKCHETPMPIKEIPKVKIPVTKCTEPCQKYWQCRLEGGRLEKPNLSCAKPDGCMCDCLSAGVCGRDDIISAKVIEEVPRAERCPMQICGAYWNCQVEKMTRPERPELDCVKPLGCRCECLSEGVCARDHFFLDKDEMMPIDRSPPLEQCSNEKCANYWMCSWMAVRDDKLTCIKPEGCICNCAAAGICANADMMEIVHLASKSSLVWPPRGAAPARPKCENLCTEFQLCRKRLDPERCQMPNNCNCGPLPLDENEPKH